MAWKWLQNNKQPQTTKLELDFVDKEMNTRL